MGRLTTKAFLGVTVIGLFLFLFLLLSMKEFSGYKSFEAKQSIHLYEIKKVAKLISLEHSAVVTISINDPLRWQDFGLSGALTSFGREPLPGTAIKYVAVGQGRVVVGIDVEKIDLIEQSNGEKLLQLPQPEIMYRFIDVDSWEIIYQEEPYVRRFIKPLTQTEIRQLETEALESLVREVHEKGLLEEAAQKAKEQIEKLLQEKDIVTVQIVQNQKT
ncbi:DUF4230 domain-containing protein [Heliorestis convoluta]|uniref:DUF4230 domain-containing protein n=1 Tax=Heliorestis convoluta TaxID=356322 RepID=A0A5Q2N1J6_9FIRM|nr:DUF4230 domain-containing protein [Heliorestis convoluta]QGG47162.1 hypothetical protein FTV88_1010 [Heliorestis convoluta]